MMIRTVLPVLQLRQGLMGICKLRKRIISSFYAIVEFRKTYTIVNLNRLKKHPNYLSLLESLQLGQVGYQHLTFNQLRSGH